MKDIPIDCRHIFGNMASWPRLCMTCGKDESTIQNERLEKIFQPKSLDDCKEAFEKWFEALLLMNRGKITLLSKDFAYLVWEPAFKAGALWSKYPVDDNKG